MNNLTEKVYKLGPTLGLFDTTVVNNLYPDKSKGARALLVARAIESGEIIRLKPGLYCLSKEFRKTDPHPFAIAGILYPPSFVSLETALSYHGLIPEAVYQVASVSLKRTTRFDTQLGNFSYDCIPSKPFFAGVSSIEVQKNSWVYVASALRAIADIIYLRKIEWKEHGLKFLTDSMRIYKEDLSSMDFSPAKDILDGFKSRRVRTYIKKMMKELKP